MACENEIDANCGNFPDNHLQIDFQAAHEYFLLLKRCTDRLAVQTDEPLLLILMLRMAYFKQRVADYPFVTYTKVVCLAFRSGLWRQTH